MRSSRVGCYSSPWAYCLPLPGEAVEPAAHLGAVAAAPPMIEATLKAAYDAATLTFRSARGTVRQWAEKSPGDGEHSFPLNTAR
jgi:hypothetical protein